MPFAAEQPGDPLRERLGSRHRRLPAALAGAVFLAPLSAYLWSMPPDIVFEDAGVLVSACHTRGIPHPPGYPLYTLLCWPFAHTGGVLPVSPAKGVAILSALLNSAAAVVLCWTLLQLLGSRALAAALALTYALGRESWSQSTIPEVYTLNALLFFLAFALALRHLQTGRFAHVAAAALVSGLALSNHWPLFLVSAPALALLLAGRPDRLRALLSLPRVAACLALLALGLLPYAHMLSPPEGAYAFIGPVGEAGGLWDYVSRQIYLDRIGRLEIQDRLIHSLDAVPLLAEEHAYLAVPFLLLGVWLSARSGDRWLCAAVLWLPFSSLVLLKVVSGAFWVNEVERHGFAVYHQVAYGLSLFFAGVALAWLRARLRVAAVPFALALGALPLTSLAVHAGENARGGDTLALRMAELFWEELPQGTRVDMLGDLTFPGTYLRVTRRLRPDVRLVSLEELLGRPLESGMLPRADAEALVEDGGPLFLARPLTGDFRVRYRGLFSELLPGDGPAEALLSEETARFFSGLIAAYPEERNRWNRAYTRHAIEELSRMLHRVRHGNPGLYTDRLKALHWETQSIPPGRKGVFLGRVVDGVDPLPPAEIVTAARSLRLEDPHISDGERAALLHIAGTAYAAGAGLTSNQAKAMFRNSLALNPSPVDNPSVTDLLALHASLEEWGDYARVRGRYGLLGSPPALAGHDRACAAALGRPCAPGGG